MHSRYCEVIHDECLFDSSCPHQALQQRALPGCAHRPPLRRQPCCRGAHTLGCHLFVLPAWHRSTQCILSASMSSGELTGLGRPRPYAALSLAGKVALITGAWTIGAAPTAQPPFAWAAGLVCLRPPLPPPVPAGPGQHIVCPSPAHHQSCRRQQRYWRGMCMALCGGRLQASADCGALGSAGTFTPGWSSF